MLEFLYGKTDWDEPRLEVGGEDENLCCARIWKGYDEARGKVVDGYGSRCQKPKIGDGDYCNRCQKKADVTCEPCTFWKDTDERPKGARVGTKKGLFYGRFDEEYPITDATGQHITVVWKRPEIRKKIVELMTTDGLTYHPCTDEGKKGRTLPPRISSDKKTSKKQAKKSTSLKILWKKLNNKKVRQAIIDFGAHTGKSPASTLLFLEDAMLDVESAIEAYDKLTPPEWKQHCDKYNFKNEKYNVDELGNYEGKLDNGMVLGNVSRLCSIIWTKMSDEDKQLFKTEQEDASTGAAASASTIAAASAAASPVAEPIMQEDSEENEEVDADVFILHDGQKVFVVMDTCMAYTEDGDELGKVNLETKKFI